MWLKLHKGVLSRNISTENRLNKLNPILSKDLSSAVLSLLVLVFLNLQVSPASSHLGFGVFLGAFLPSLGISWALAASSVVGNGCACQYSWK